MFHIVSDRGSIATLKAGEYREYRILGPNSSESPFIATAEDAQKRLATFDTYVQYGATHTMVSRPVTVGEWA